MKIFNKMMALLIAIIMISSIFAACGSADVRQDETIKAGQTQAVPGTDAEQTRAADDTGGVSAFPLSVKDANGTEMTIPKEPLKIVSLTLGTDEMLLGDADLPGLVDGSRIASVTTFAIDPGVSNVAEAAQKVPNTYLSKDAEKIIALQPDLILVDTWADANFLKQLRDANLTVYAFKTPSNIQEQKAAILEIARIVGAEDRGKSIVGWMDEKLKAVEDKLKALKPEDRLVMLDYSEMGSTSGKGTNTDDILTRAGVVNAAAKAGMEGWPPINKENVVEWNPDVILLPSWYYDQKNSLEGMKAMLRGDKSLAGVKAIADDRLITVPYQHMSAISQYVVLAVEDVARAVYPELFK